MDKNLNILDLKNQLQVFEHLEKRPKLDVLSEQNEPEESMSAAIHPREALYVEENEEELGSAGDNAAPVLEPIIVHEFDSQRREILMDEAREFGFWGWLTKFGYLGFPSLLNFFQVPPSVWENGATDEELLAILRSVFSQNVVKRTRLLEHSTFLDAVELINKAQNIVVLTGAGVSVSCGIPDFRSKNGIYSRLAEFELSDPQEMFDLAYFKFRPETFYSFAKEIYPSNFKPSPSHMFIKMLQDKGKLLRNYTQNIDTLENLAGIKPEKLVQCHGSFASATCITCKYKVPGKAIEAEIFSKTVPRFAPR
ncbi:NAD-dependent histone deacetylase sir2, partial [Kappamyces sp. JEL0680]